MPTLAHRMLYAIRALLEEESPSSRKIRRASSMSGLNERSRQNVALVLTFRDLFSSSNLNLVLEDMGEVKGKYKTNERNFNTPKSKSVCLGRPIASSSPILTRSSEISNGIEGLSTTSPTVWPLVLKGTDETIPLIREERILSSSRISLQNIDYIIGQPLATSEKNQLTYTKKSQKVKTEHLTVNLNPNNEKETAAVLRKILKWSPRKRRTVSFAVPIPRKEEQKAVAIVQNAVNRVKEENFNKKKKKWKCLMPC